MATTLHLPMASSFPCTSSSSLPSSSSSSSKRRSFSTTCLSLNTKSSARKMPIPPLNPNDPFIKKLASVAANAPEKLKRPSNPDMLPYLDIFDSPDLMASSAQVESSVSYNEHRPRSPPPDLPSLILNGRIVFLGMPLVPAVTELIIAQLMYLQWADPKEPIYIYINSTGTTRDDGETVGLETEGFAIYDAMMLMTNEIYTLGIGAAVGQACLLLAAGTKGKRFMMPHAKAMIQQPRVPPSGLLQASDVLIRAKEAITNRDTLVELLAKHTGNPIETVANVMRRPFYMDAIKAREFGVIDKIYWRGQEQFMYEVDPPEEWDKNAGVKTPDAI